MTPPIVKSYLIALERYKWIGLASFLLIVTGSTVFAMQPGPPKKYLAEGWLSYNRPPVSFSTTGSEIQTQGQEMTEQILLSDQIVSEAAAKINVKPRDLANNVVVKMPKKSKSGEVENPFITVQYQDTDQQRAGDAIVTLMKAMVNQSSTMNSGRLKAIIAKITDRLPQARQELQLAERRLEAYDRREGALISKQQSDSFLASITGSQGQQQQILLTISGVDAQIRSLQEKLGLSANQAYISSALSADPIIANLRTQIYQVESQIELLRKDLRAEHPTMIQLRRQKEAAEQLLQQRATEVIGGNGTAAPLASNSTAIRSQSSLDPARQQLANRLVDLQTQRESLQNQLASLRQAEAKYRREYAIIPNKILERERLEQQRQLKKNLYETMQAKLVDAKTAEAETVSSLSVARPPIVTAQPTATKSIPLTLAIGSFLGLIVGGGVVFLLGQLEGTFKTMEDIRDSLRQQEVNILGIIPLMSAEDLPRHAVPVVMAADSPYLEFYEKFRSNLRRMGGKGFKVVLITSTSSDEGKTISAYNLGIASARAGKRTLIVETDLRSPSGSHSLKVTPDPDSTIEPLRYYGSLSECIRLVPDIENLYIIPSPGPLRQAAAVLESSEMRRLMEDVRGRFDLVILDTPPLSLSNDALLIQHYSDGIVLVTRPGSTQENLLTEAIDQLTEDELPLKGAIINGADIVVNFPFPVPEPPAPPPEDESESPEVSPLGRNN
ncbi:MAG: polysaccharide biosynthesis tyrosine autokinase [Nostocaceae cyanobacterium]|nr:polysaccharide biosynthesis tyrosine autokinase [Nostocaceae cyanobacterium]